MTICAHVTINQDVDVQAVVDIAEEAGRAIMEVRIHPATSIIPPRLTSHPPFHCTPNAP